MSPVAATATIADLFDRQTALVRTGKFVPQGRIRTISIGPCASYTPPPDDLIINGWGAQPQRNARGRMLDLSDQWLPFADAGADSISGAGRLLVTSPMIRKDGYVGLPDLVDPLWRAPDFSAEEAANPDCDANCRKLWDIVPDGKGKTKRVQHVHVNLRGDKDKPRMIPQRLEDRTNDRLQGTNFLVFQPLLNITYQPESLTGDKHDLKPAEWRIEFLPDTGGIHSSFLVDPTNGECHFFGGVAHFLGESRRYRGS
jgi:hypothetical protein